MPESADWYNAGFLMLWGSNVPQTRTPDAHFYTEVRYRGTKSAVVSPDYSEAAKFGDIWLNPQAGTDAALAMAMGHVILREYHLDRQAEYFEDYARKYTDMPMLVRLEERDGHLVPGRMLRAEDFDGGLGETNNPDWKTVAYDEASGQIVAPNGSIGFRWGEEGKWNLEQRAKGAEANLRLSQILDEHHDEVVGVDFPYFGGVATGDFVKCDHPEVLTRNIPGAPRDAGRWVTGAGRHGVRPVLRQLRAGPGPWRQLGVEGLQRRQPLYPRLGRKDHRRRARKDHRRGAGIRGQCRKDPWQVHGHPRGRSEPLVPHGHELPRHHQHAGDVRLHRPGRRRLVALCGAGKAAPADRLGAAGLRAGLEPPAAAHELDLVLVCPYRPVAL